MHWIFLLQKLSGVVVVMGDSMVVRHQGRKKLGPTPERHSIKSHACCETFHHPMWYFECLLCGFCFEGLVFLEYSKPLMSGAICTLLPRSTVATA
jgi:hypothetical protein